MNTKWKKDIINAFPPKEREEVARILEHWNDEGNAAHAEMCGIADRPRPLDERTRIYAALNAAPPDGFTVWFANGVGVSLEEARKAMLRAVNEERTAG